MSFKIEKMRMANKANARKNDYPLEYLYKKRMQWIKWKIRHGIRLRKEEMALL